MDFDFSTETITPDITNTIIIGGTGGLILPIGNTANRPTAVDGVLRYNTDHKAIECYGSNPARWVNVGNCKSAATTVAGASPNFTPLDHDINTIFGYYEPTPGVKLPQSYQGGEIFIANDNSISIEIHPYSGDMIGGTTNPFVLPPNAHAWFYCSYTGDWYTSRHTLISLNYATDVLSIANGGTGQTTAAGSLNALLPTQTGNSGKYLTTDGSNTSWATISGSGTVTSVAVSGGTTGLTTSGGPITTSGTITLGGTLGVANGGTGQTTAGAAFDALAPVQTGNSGKYLTTDGTTTSWATVSGSGTVTSVAASTTTSGLSITGSPITTSGTLTINLSSQLQSFQTAIGGVTNNLSILYWNGSSFSGAGAGAGNKLLMSNGSGVVFSGFIPLGISLLSGTTTESTLKLASGVQLTTPQDGAVEWDGTNLYLTQTTGPTRKTVAYADFSNATGTLAINRGGTGLSTTPTNGQLLIGNGTNYTLAGLTQGTGITVTNGSGSITVANAGVTSTAGTTNQITASASTGAVTLSLPSNVIVPGSIQVTTTLNQTQSTAVTAAGTDPATATAISSRYNIVTTVASGTGIRLPIPTTPFGTEIFVSNRGANTLTIYPNSGAAIANGAANAGILLPAGQETTLVCTSATQWYTTEPILAAGTNITLTPSAGVLTIAASGGGGSPGGSTTQVQYNNAGAFAGATNVTIDNNDIVLLENTTPVTPTAGVKLFGKKLANRMLPAMVGPSTMDACMQPSIWRQKIAWWNPPGNATTVPGVLGMSALSALGTPVSRTVATTNLMTRTRRLGYSSVTTAAAFAGHYATAAQYTTGNGAGLGGFFYSCRFAASDAATVAGVREFVGLSSSVAVPTNVQPNTITNCIGVAQLSTDTTQLYIVYGGSVAQTAIALGTNFPPSANGATTGTLYDLTLFSPPNQDAVVYYRVERVGTAFIAEGTLSGTPGTTTPANTTLLAHRAWRCNNATLLAVSLDIINVYIETDY